MAYTTLKSAIQAVIKQNGNNEITGALLQQALLSMIDSLGAEYQFGGGAEPTDNPGTPDYKVAYIASNPGTYSNFGGITLADGELAILLWNGSAWSKQTTGISTMFANPDTINGGIILSKGGNVVARVAEQDNAIALNNALADADFSTLTPDSVISGNVVTDTGVVGSASYDVWVFQITPGVNYDFTGALLAGIARRLVYYSSDSAGANIVGWDVYKGSEETTERQDFAGPLHIPAGANYILLNVRTYSDTFVLRFKVREIERTAPIKVKTKFDEIGRSLVEVAKGGLIDYKHLVSYIAGPPLNVSYQANSAWDALWIRLCGQTRIELQGATTTAYNFFGSETEINTDTFISRNKTGVVPDGAKVCICSMAHASNPDGYDELRLVFDYRPKLRVLSIGNSYSQDSLSYVPYILQSLGYYNVEIGILMLSSSTLQQHVENFDNETAAYTYYKYDGHEEWLSAGASTIQNALVGNKWDVILLQQQSKAAWDYTTYQPYLNQLISRIFGTINYGVKFGWLEVQSRPATGSNLENYSDADISAHFESIAENAEKVISETLCGFCIPVGAAIQNARTIPEIKALGGYAQNANNTSGLGYLNYSDGVHLQEGLPCLIAAYASVCAFLKLMGAEITSIYGDTTRPTDDWLSGKSIPGAHGGSVGVTDDNCRIAQAAAIIANKKPYDVTDINYIVNPE